MVEYHGRFAWYELITTDVAAAKAFYGKVVGWGARDASTSALPYTLFTSGTASVGGLMDLPEDGRKLGATPRWMGYVDVKDVDAMTDRLARLGGAVYVPPTDSNIGRIAVVADPQTANLAMVTGMKSRLRQPVEREKSGQVGWHELLAADQEKALAFYGELFGWQKADAEFAPAATYQLFSVHGQTIGAMFNKQSMDPIPFWLFYINVEDIDAAAERVTTAGGRVFEGPLQMPSGNWIARCGDPQGAAFALQGERNRDAVGWSSEWGGFSSKGRLVKSPP